MTASSPSTGRATKRSRSWTAERRPLRSAVAAVAVLAALASAGCGAVGLVTSGDAGKGKALFIEKCGSCHTMADAGTKGAVGPNLDDAFDSDKKQGFDEQTIRDVVRGQIAYAETDPATGSPGMPQNIVTGSDADSVATYVAKCAAVAHCNVTAPGTPPPSGGGGGGGATTTTAGGGGSSGKLAEGKRIFESAGCVSCHTLKDAGSHGAVGPNLDQVKPSKALAVTRVTNGKGVMPSFKGQLSPAQIDAVATYVSSVAGK